jgi:hypothetical protein
MKKILLRCTLLVLVVSVLGYLAVQRLISTRPVSSLPALERFPILSRFELPRDYGYFIGDEILLTLVIETTGSIVVDLVNLPQKGEKHGVFEIRDLTLTSSAVAPEHKVYRATYTLQYFGPTPLIVPFAPVEILYAHSADKASLTKRYTYQSLFTQPVPISISRISPYHAAQPLAIKGPADDPRSGRIWAAVALGTVCVLTALGGWSCAWWKKQQQHHTLPNLPLSAADTALHTLQTEEVLFFRPLVEPSCSVGVRLAQILRAYMETAWQVPAFTMTTAELTTCLHSTPLAQEILSILEQCESLKYAPPTDSAREEQILWQEAIQVFAKLQEVPSP